MVPAVRYPVERTEKQVISNRFATGLQRPSIRGVRYANGGQAQTIFSVIAGKHKLFRLKNEPIKASEIQGGQGPFWTPPQLLIIYLDKYSNVLPKIERTFQKGLFK